MAMSGYYVNTGIIYLIVGFSTALICHFVLRRHTMGSFWGALLVGVIGSFLGAVLDYLLHDPIVFLANIGGSVNVFPPVITSFLCLWIFWRVSSRGRNK